MVHLKNTRCRGLGCDWSVLMLMSFCLTDIINCPSVFALLDVLLGAVKNILEIALKREFFLSTSVVILFWLH